MDLFLAEVRHSFPELASQIVSVEEMSDASTVKVFKVNTVNASQEAEEVVAKWAYIGEGARERRQKFAHVRHHPSKEEVQDRKVIEDLIFTS